MILQNTALLTIDMQNDVLKHIVPTGISIVPAIQRVLAACRTKNISIIHCLRVHRSDGIDVEKFRLKQFHKEPFLVRHTEGAQLIHELEARCNEHQIYKARFSAFFQSDLQMLLTRLAVSSVVVCGVQTPNCIRCTVTDAIAYDYNVIALEDAITAADPEIHRANMQDMENMGVTVTTTNSFIATLLKA